MLTTQAPPLQLLMTPSLAWHSQGDNTTSGQVATAAPTSSLFSSNASRSLLLPHSSAISGFALRNTCSSHDSLIRVYDLP